MLKAVIVDDEPKSCEALNQILNDFITDVQVVGIVHNVKDAIEAIENYKPDVVFLDIEMHTETGFDLLGQIDKIDFEVVFTTAFQQYALKAIKFCAIDYLLKPIDVNELESAVEKVKKKRSEGNMSKNFEMFLQNLRNTNSGTHQIALSTNEGLIFVHVNEIIYCEADGPYTYFFLKKGDKITVSKNLKEYEDLLSDHNFFRVHKSYLINLGEMKKYIKGDGGYVIMTNNKEVAVSKRKKDAFLAKLSMVKH
jgi:two-component system LytT family response regulator